ncbi:TetR/AcrR family transcriptional regulator [Pseudoxanthobacter sp. M-2]|uniref:TetR/AcrR family transcriptional regulator n=1 Tax=Pseudoxanthobacter sp. M-2 TaxID=3078754 RepID=UPI0038FC184E
MATDADALAASHAAEVDHGTALAAARSEAASEAPTPIPPGADPAKRRQILEGANGVFMELGFDAASMGAIARAAGVSKGTLYVYFDSKEALFSAMIADERARLKGHLDLDADDPDVAESLRRTGRKLVAFIVRPANIRAVRTVMGISERIPAVGRAFYEDGPGRGIDKFTRFIEAHARAGRLIAPDPRLAAAQLQMLLQAGLVNELLYDVREPPDEAEIAAHVDAAVATFLARYAAR